MLLLFKNSSTFSDMKENNYLNEAISRAAIGGFFKILTGTTFLKHKSLMKNLTTFVRKIFFKIFIKKYWCDRI